MTYSHTKKIRFYGIVKIGGIPAEHCTEKGSLISSYSSQYPFISIVAEISDNFYKGKSTLFNLISVNSIPVKKYSFCIIIVFAVKLNIILNCRKFRHQGYFVAVLNILISKKESYPGFSPAVNLPLCSNSHKVVCNITSVCYFT